MKISSFCTKILTFIAGLVILNLIAIIAGGLMEDMFFAALGIGGMIDLAFITILMLFLDRLENK